KSTTAVAVAIPVVSFGLPLLDVSISVIRRFLNNKPLFRGDDEHVHHKLLKRGLSHRKAVLVLYAVAAAFGLLSLTLLHGEVMIGFVLFVIGLGMWWGIQELKYVELYELVSTARQVWRRKRVITNDLVVRRAIESLSGTSEDVQGICRILRGALDPIGFCGLAFCFPKIEWMDENLLFPLRSAGECKASYSWMGLDIMSPEWELKYELVSSSGNKIGDFFLLRARASERLLLDINLLNIEFRAAISGALERAIEKIPVASRPPIQSAKILTERVAPVTSQSD
ncbi:MAG: hypothetical protein ACHQ1H_05745, partial [Nitrososphaerales archaeon]